MPRKGLGKGLGALIPSLQASEKRQIVEIPVDELKPNPYQPRIDLDEEAINSLAESIRAHGIIQPIVVREKEGHYEIVAGERRFRAAKKAGLEKVPAVVKNIGDEECALVALVENLQRENLNPLEEALAYRNLQERFGLKQEEIAERIGISRSSVANTLRILSLPDEVKEMIARDQLSRGHAVALSGLQDRELQIRAAKTIVRNSLSVREAEKLVNLLKGKKERKEKSRTQRTSIREIEEKIAEKTGLKTEIKIKKSAVEVVIKARSLDEIKEMLERLNG